jgi:hypothetical protein
MHLTENELMDIANEVRIRITGGRGVTLEDYANLAKSKKGDEIGLFYLWAIKQHPNIKTYFPDNILEILSKKVGRHYYSENENQLIKENAIRGVKYLALELNVPPYCVYKQARLIGVKIPRGDYTFYSAEEEQMVLREGLNQTDEALAEKLRGRSSRSIQIKRLNAGLKKKELFYWSKNPEKENYLIRHYNRLTYDQIANKLGLRYHQVKTKVERLKTQGKI